MEKSNNPDDINQKLKVVSNTIEKADSIKSKPKPPKIEDKPFSEFINQHLIPGIKQALTSKGINLEALELNKTQRPVVGGECWVLFGQLSVGRKFWLTFDTDNIKSSKNISIAESSSEPSLLESFLIDEKRITLQLIISRLLQRLNGQKWLDPN